MKLDRILRGDSIRMVDGKHVCPFCSGYLPLNMHPSASITWFIE